MPAMYVFSLAKERKSLWMKPYIMCMRHGENDETQDGNPPLGIVTHHHIVRHPFFFVTE
jgi:hypothetical protein